MSEFTPPSKKSADSPQRDAVHQRQSAAVLQDNRAATLQAKAGENRTGMPDQLKSGIENLSGMNMDHVRVHYNSDKPAQLNAHAYAQGSQIHLAPGQEKHLPHEAWHVVQQAQGRVRPTMQMKGGENVNDDAGLEYEADVMGGRALVSAQLKMQAIVNPASLVPSNLGQSSTGIIQRRTEIHYTRGAMTYWTSGLNTNNLAIGVMSDALLDPGDPKTGSRTAAAPHPSPYTNGNWPTLYQGHLLNANLGGQAIPENLFPVTPAFNGQHSSVIEDHVKANLLELHNLQHTAATAANNVNRRLHYRVEVINPHLGGTFRPAHVGNTIFRCAMGYTLNNVGPGLGTGHDNHLPHAALDLHVPPPSVTLNEQLNTLGWGPDAAPTYSIGVFPGAPHAANVRTVLDGHGNTVADMFINI